MRLLVVRHFSKRTLAALTPPTPSKEDILSTINAITAKLSNQFHPPPPAKATPSHLSTPILAGFTYPTKSKGLESYENLFQSEENENPPTCFQNVAEKNPESSPLTKFDFSTLKSNPTNMFTDLIEEKTLILSPKETDSKFSFPTDFDPSPPTTSNLVSTHDETDSKSLFASGLTKFPTPTFPTFPINNPSSSLNTPNLSHLSPHSRVTGQAPSQIEDWDHLIQGLQDAFGPDAETEIPVEDAEDMSRLIYERPNLSSLEALLAPLDPALPLSLDTVMALSHAMRRLCHSNFHWMCLMEKLQKHFHVIPTPLLIQAVHLAVQFHDIDLLFVVWQHAPSESLTLSFFEPFAMATWKLQPNFNLLSPILHDIHRLGLRPSGHFAKWLRSLSNSLTEPHFERFRSQMERYAWNLLSENVKDRLKIREVIGILN